MRRLPELFSLRLLSLVLGSMTLCVGGGAGCAHVTASPPAQPIAAQTGSMLGDASWLQGLARWKEERLISIAGEDGWITLVARAWLRPGENHFGSDPKNELVLPAGHAPPLAGSIMLTDDSLRVRVEPGVDLRVEGQPVRERALADDREQKPTVMLMGSLRMHVIKRQDRLALRVKDREHPARKSFPGLRYYPAEPLLRVRATLEPAPAGETLPIVNVLGQTERMPLAGTLRFSLGGVAYTLAAVREAGEDELFILFKDQTAGHGTYPSGRFLYTPPPAADGSVELDFNRAFNPPCAFTTFATCPIPPAQNRLARPVEAGEKYDGAH